MLIFVLGIFFTACQKEDFVPQDDFADQTSDDAWNDEDVYDDGDGQDHDHSADGEEGALSNYSVSGDNISLIKDYEVAESLKSFQNDKERHHKIWEHIRRLIPIENRDKIAEFEVFHGGGSLSGYVAPLDHQDLSRWKFAMAIDMEGDLDDVQFQNYYTYVALHEFGHIVTINDTQIDLKDESDCTNYFTGEGCSTKNSYINRIFELGWADIIDQHNPEFPETTYEKYQDRFHTDYAATNPGEDVAEVFTHFVMTNEIPPGTTIAEQKVRLLFEYPELVSLRKKIRENVRPISARAPMPSLKGKIRVCGHGKKKGK